ncbi:MAG: flavodoxin family protein [Candidatus Heimdallarchaeota archaeon]
MRTLCISASNVQHKKKSSTSTETCSLVEKIITEDSSQAIEQETIALLDYTLAPCIFCGKCSTSSKCTYDDAFNSIYSKILKSDVIFVVVPHYAIIPAKLTIIMEKLNQILYTAWIRDPNSKFELAGKRVGIIGHGGGDERSFQHYENCILKPLNYLFASLQFKVVGIDDQQPKGIVFGVTGMEETNESIFPDIVHDWQQIKEKITPLILNGIQNQ